MLITLGPQFYPLKDFISVTDSHSRGQVSGSHLCPWATLHIQIQVQKMVMKPYYELLFMSPSSSPQNPCFTIGV